MSTPDVIDSRFDEVVSELRAGRVAAPVELRERVRALADREPEPPPARSLRGRLRLRRLVLVGTPLVAGGAVAAALVIGLVQSGGKQQPRRTALQPVLHGAAQKAVDRAGAVGTGTVLKSEAQTNTFRAETVPRPAGGRAQLYGAELTLRVRDLSAATKRALRLTRAFGGYVRTVDSGSGTQSGRAYLVVRIPVRRVQEAIVRFSSLGRIVDQHVSIQDVQPSIDKRFRAMQALRRQIAALQAKVDPASLAKVALLQRRLVALQREQARTLRRTSFATVSLVLQTKQAAVAPPKHKSRLHRSLDRAGSVLVDELVVCLYVLVVGGPLLILLGVAWLGGRTLRRRALDRLLERS
jgi:hypothetical protein